MGRVRLPALAAVALASALVVAGCGERSEPTGATVALYPVTVRSGSGDSVSLRRRPVRIAALTPGATEILAALGAGRRIVGVPENARHGAAPRARAVVDRNGRLGIERLAATRPDLVIASPTTVAPELTRLRARTRARVYVPPENSLSDVERAVGDIGLLVDEPIAARRLISKLETARQRVARRVAGTALVSVFVDTGFFTTVSSRSLIGDLIRIAHGRNVAGAAPEPGPVDTAQLLRLNPRVYLATSESETSLRALRKDRVTRRLAAVRAGRFAVIRSSLLLPAPSAAEGLVRIARALHPHAFR